MNSDDLGLRWEHGIWPDGEPFVRSDLRRGDLWLRLTLHRCADGHLELVALDMDNRLGIAAIPLPLDEGVRRLVAILLHDDTTQKERDDRGL
jgi:hypothetical protein